jgi:hypothetical protein
LGFALFGVSIAPPVLDAHEGSKVASIEVVHTPSHCASQHDHAACSQLARSHAVPGGASPSSCLGLTTYTAGTLLHDAPRALVRHVSSLPRAPPSIT